MRIERTRWLAKSQSLGCTGLAVSADVRDPARSSLPSTPLMRGSGGSIFWSTTRVVSDPDRFVDQSERSWRRHIEMNLVSMFTATSEAATR